MINANLRLRILVIISVFIVNQYPSNAGSGLNLPFPSPTVNGKSVIDDSSDKNSPLITQGSNAAEVADIAAAGEIVSKKLKGEALITDSLWGNLILDMAYQRDPEIKKIMKRLNIVNLGTMGVVSAVAGGTLAQGIITLATLNPQPGHNDTYLPSSIGVGMAGLTLVTFVGRAAINHCLVTQMRNRQLVIKHQVEAILARFESSRGENTAAQTELTVLIGERAANEWAQLWRSANVLASTSQLNISLLPSVKSRIASTMRGQ